MKKYSILIAFLFMNSLGSAAEVASDFDTTVPANNWAPVSFEKKLNYAEMPITEVKGKSHGLADGFCRLTYEMVGEKKALTVAFNRADGSTASITSIIAPAADWHFKNSNIIAEVDAENFITRGLSYLQGELLLHNGDRLRSHGEITNYYIQADPELTKIGAIRVRFFEEVNTKGRNEVGSAECSAAQM